MDLSNISNEQLKDLTPEERQAVLQILSEFSADGVSSSYQKLLDDDWEEIPVDIHTFIHDRKYLGNALYDQDGNFTLFHYWEEQLEKLFPDPYTTAYNTLVLTGAIGIGKTTMGVICQLYLLYRLLCMKDPYLYYGMQPIDKLSISDMNITLENAKGVALDKMNQMLLSSEWFMSHGKMAGITNLEYRPEKHIEIIAASSNNQIIGRALFCLDGDTVISTDSGFYKIKDLVDKDFKCLTKGKRGIQYSEKCTAKETVVSNEEYQIELEDGTVIKCTPNHRFLLKDGSYKEAQYLTEEDEIEDFKI